MEAAVLTTSINNIVSSQLTLADLLSAQSQASTPGAASVSDATANSSTDSPAIWAAAQTPSAGFRALDSVTVALNRASSVSDVAGAAGKTVSNLLGQPA